MPLPITKGAASAQGFGQFTTIGPNGLHWIALLDSEPQTLEPYSIAIDKNGAIYIGGYITDPGGGYTRLYIAKYNTSGSFQWQRQIGNASVYAFNGAVVTDYANDLYLCGYSSNDIVLSKHDSSGNLIWQKKLGDSATIDRGSGVGVDASGNVYIAGYSNPYLQIAKYDSTGIIQWQRKLANGYANASAVDTSGNMYVGGYDLNSNSNGLTLKIDSSATVLWQKQLGSTSNDVLVNGVGFDSSGNVYSCGYWTDSGTSIDYGFVAKYSSTGVLQWQRKLTSPDNRILLYAIAIDTSGNVYVGGNNYSSAYVIKYSTTGTLLWQRTITDATYVSSITTDSKSNVYIAIRTTNLVYGNGEISNWKVPSDGSLTGTYTVGGKSFTYSAGSLSDSAGSLTDSSSSLSASVSTLPGSTTSFATATPSAVSSTTQI